MQTMTKKTIDWTLFRKVLDHTADEKEQSEFEKWLHSDLRHREYYERARRFYAGESVEPLPLDETFAALKTRLEMHNQPKPMYRRRTYYGIAAAVAVIVVLSCFDWHRDSAETAMGRVCYELAREYAPATDKARLIVDGDKCYDLHGDESLSIDVRGGHIERGDDNRLVYTADAEAEVVQNRLSVPRGGYYSVLLEDGTTVHLNAESELVYPSAFSKDVRTVSLVGEAYFDVAHDAGRPFVVEVNGYSIEVLGTQFNVTAYADEQICRSTLVEGSVRIVPNSGRDGEEIVLTPGEQVVHETGTDTFSVARVNTKVYTAWMDREFVFENTPLSEALRIVSRWYDFRYDITDSDLEKYTFTGQISKDGGLDYLFRVLYEAHMPIVLRYEDGMLYVDRR